MENKLFRKNALDKISSPEQLNEHMKVAGPGMWVMLGGLAVTFAAFIVWGLFGSIPEMVVVSGIALNPENAPIAVYCFLPIEDSRNLRVGMEARISPQYAPPEQFGYIYGEIRSIDSVPVTVDYLKDVLAEDYEYVNLPPGVLIKVVIDVIRDEYGQLEWSSHRGEDVELVLGAYCNVTIVTAERSPIDLILR